MTSTKRANHATDGRRMPLMSPPVRKTVLCLHVMMSVSWLGIDFAMLTLGITGLTSSNLETMRESYVTMNRFGQILVMPAGLGAVLTGLLLGLCTPWGLFRYSWVTVKLVIGLVALTLAVFALPIQLHHAASQVTGPDASTDIGFVANTLVIAPSIALMLYTSNLVLSIFKPWGRISRGASRTPKVADRGAPDVSRS